MFYILESDNWYDWWRKIWRGSDANPGHYQIINKMDLDLFSKGATNDTETIHNRWIVADAAYLTDEGYMSAEKEGNYGRDDAGNINTNEEKMYSPYHAKSEYDITHVVHHLGFLYELSRQRLILKKSFDMIPTNYSATNTYYGYSIEWKMKRRVIADLRNLYSSLYNHYKDTDVKINTVYGKGYMILGVFLHLVQDLQAHRATITADMIFETYDSTSCDKSVFYNYDNCVDSKKDSRVNGKSFIKASCIL